MYGVIWTYPWDVLDAGIDTALARIANEGGMQAVSLSHSYHNVKHLRPHNPTSKLFVANSSAIYFQPDLKRYGAVKPIVAPLVQEDDGMRRIRDAVERHGLAYHAWTVTLHNSALGTIYPDINTLNAMGDRIPHYLCPSNPDVRAYISALVGDIADNLAPAQVELEFLHFGTFEHDVHHGIPSVELDPFTEYLLGLCFCPHCLSRAQNEGVDGDAVRNWARDHIIDYLEGDQLPALGGLGDNIAGHALTFAALDGYLRMRIESVMSLWADCKQALGGKSDFVPIVNMGVGMPEQAAIIQALDGVDIARALDENIPNELLDCAAYSLDGLVLARAVHDLQRLVNDRVPIREGLRLIPPQVITSADVAGQIAKVRALGIDRVNVYNYGLMRLANLHAAKQALA
ncbi:MAG: hypothetical protein OXE05_10010 [Chloroflexi bacterium]|nr:hypothetical protein [Chloroflexota bacterium]